MCCAIVIVIVMKYDQVQHISVIFLVIYPVELNTTCIVCVMQKAEEKIVVIVITVHDYVVNGCWVSSFI